MWNYSKARLHPEFLHVLNQEPSVASTILENQGQFLAQEKTSSCISDFIQVIFRITQSIKKDGEIDALGIHKLQDIRKFVEEGSIQLFSQTSSSFKLNWETGGRSRSSIIEVHFRVPKFLFWVWPIISMVSILMEEYVSVTHDQFGRITARSVQLLHWST